jgi:rhamnosyltransferase subunit B
MRRAFLRWGVRRFIDPVALEDVNAARIEHGLHPLPTLMPEMMGLADLSVALFPAWFGPTQPDWPAPLYRAGFPLYDPNPDAPLPPRLAHFLDAGPAPVVFTPGTGNTQAVEYFRHAKHSAARLGLRAIFLTPHHAQLPPDLPSSIFWQDYVPLRSLLPRVAALVHHGGIGTTAEALRAGTPQLVVPLAHDQFDNAARVVLLGAGASLRATKLDTERLVHTLGGVAGNAAMAGRCKAIAARFTAEHPLPGLCARLEGLVR